MIENYDDTDNSAVAILVNVLMKLEQLTPQTFKVQDILDLEPKALQGNNCNIKSNVHPKKGKKEIFIFKKQKKMENPNMPITKCGLINLCYSIHTRFISTHFFKF